MKRIDEQKANEQFKENGIQLELETIRHDLFYFSNIEMEVEDIIQKLSKFADYKTNYDKCCSKILFEKYKSEFTEDDLITIEDWNSFCVKSDRTNEQVLPMLYFDSEEGWRMDEHKLSNEFNPKHKYYSMDVNGEFYSFDEASLDLFLNLKADDEDFVDYLNFEYHKDLFKEDVKKAIILLTTDLISEEKTNG